MLLHSCISSVCEIRPHASGFIALLILKITMISLHNNVNGDFCDHSSFFFVLAPKSVQIYANVSQINSSRSLFLSSGQSRVILKFICYEDFLAFRIRIKI